MTNTLNVLIADHSPLYCKGIELALECSSRSYSLRTVASLSELEGVLLSDDVFDLLVVDAGLPGLKRFYQLKMLLARQVQGRLLILTELCGDSFVKKAFRSGAHGVALKSLTQGELLEAIGSILIGGRFQPKHDDCVCIHARETDCLVKALLLLSEREKGVLKYLKDGLPNKEIAWHLSLTEPTVKSHISNIYRKLNMKNRTKLALTIHRMEPAGIERYGLA